MGPARSLSGAGTVWLLPGEQAVGQCEVDQFGPRRRSELVEHVIEVAFDRSGADAELVGDGLVGHASGDQSHDLLLPRSQSGRVVARHRLSCLLAAPGSWRARQAGVSGYLLKTMPSDE